MPEIPTDWWFAFECFSATCRPLRTLFDVRTANAGYPESVRCPICGATDCWFRGSWPADENGFGSISDIVREANKKEIP